MSSPNWKRNLYGIFAAEAIVLMGFGFATPFLPLYIRKVGGLDEGGAAFWSGIGSFAAGFAMFLSAPIWGIIADRFGRKPMVLRAMIGGAVVLAAMGFVKNVPALVGLRALQGLLCGTVSAASALVASTTPREKVPYAMGLLMVAVYGGNTVGPLIGGVIADNLGYEWAFYITGATLMLGAIVVMLFVRERFTRPAQGTAASLAGMFRLVKSRQVMPVLGITLSLNAGPGIISPVISLYIQKMKPGADAAALAGTAIFLMGVATTISALVAGRLGQRVNLKKMIVWCCLGTAVLCCPPMFAGTVTQLIVAMAFMDALKGGLLVTSNTLIGMVAPLDQQGIAYGINQSANSLGGALGPLIGGAVAPLIGLKYVFGVTAGVYFIVAVIAGKLLANVQLPRSAPATNAAAK